MMALADCMECTFLIWLSFVHQAWVIMGIKIFCHRSLSDAERKQREAFRLNQEQGYKVKQEYMQQGKRQKDEKLVSGVLEELLSDHNLLI